MVEGSRRERDLQLHAVRSGVRGLVAETLPGNVPMLQLIAKAGGEVAMSRDEDAIHVSELFS